MLSFALADTLRRARARRVADRPALVVFPFGRRVGRAAAVWTAERATGRDRGRVSARVRVDGQVCVGEGWGLGGIWSAMVGGDAGWVAWGWVVGGGG
jgi:hypothetical protein